MSDRDDASDGEPAEARDVRGASGDPMASTVGEGTSDSDGIPGAESGGDEGSFTDNGNEDGERGEGTDAERDDELGDKFASSEEDDGATAYDEDGAEGDGLGDEDEDKPITERLTAEQPVRGDEAVDDVASEFDPLPMITARRVDSVWKAPAGFAEPAARDAHVVLVHGNDHAGKFTAAVRLAFDTDPSREVRTYRRRPGDPLSLLEVVESGRWPPRSFVILRDGFEKGVSLRQLDEELEQLTNALADLESTLIITTELDRRTLASLAAPKVSIGGVDLRQILDSHLAFYADPENGGMSGEQRSAIERHWGELAARLTSPTLVQQLCYRVVKERVQEAGLTRLAEEIANAAVADLRVWFDGLSMDGQLYALMSYLFEGLDRASLETLFVGAISALREQGARWVKDRRRLCLGYLHEQIGRDGAAEESVELADLQLERHLAWQVGNRRLLLTAVMSALVAVAVQQRLWRDGRRRALLGAAIGRLAVHDPSAVEGDLVVLARTRSSRAGTPEEALATVPGSAMAEIVRGAPARTASVLQTLERWIDAGDADLAWAAGAALWRLYQAMPVARQRHSAAARDVHQLLKLLHRLVVRAHKLGRDTGEKKRREGPLARRSKAHDETLRCALVAVERIGAHDLEGMVAMLRQWLVAEQEDVRWVALRAARRTLKRLAGRPDEPREDKYRVLVELAARVVIDAPANAAKDALTIGRWLRWPRWRAVIEAVLLRAATAATRRQRERLRQALAGHWLASDDQLASEVARRVIERCYAMDGVLTELPELGRALVVVDPDVEAVPPPATDPEVDAARGAERRGLAVRRLLAAVGARWETRVVTLGTRPAADGAAVPVRRRPPVRPNRLMASAVAAAAGEGARLVVVLTAGPVHDLDEGLDLARADHRLVVAAGCELEVPVDTDYYRAARDLPGPDLETIEARLRLIGIRAQAALAAADWLPLLVRLGASVEDVANGPQTLLAGWVDRLDATGGEEAAPPGGSDLAKRLLAALFWLAADDLDGSLRTVHGWLSAAAGSPRRAIGVAATAALFAIPADAPPAWIGAAGSLFDRLAEPLGHAGSDGVDVVLAVVERWLALPHLAEVLAGEVEGGGSRLLRWAEAVAPQHVERFRRALQPLRRVVDNEDLGSTAPALDSALERLRIRLAIGQRRTLPDLAPGETYAVIALDASAAAGSLSRRCHLAAELLNGLHAKGEEPRPVLYRLGELSPCWVAGEVPPQGADLCHPGLHLPRLLAPVLATLRSQPVSFVLVVAEQPWVDADDGADAHWRQRLFSVLPLAGVPWTGPMGRSREACSSGTRTPRCSTSRPSSRVEHRFHGGGRDRQRPVADLRPSRDGRPRGGAAPARSSRRRPAAEPLAAGPAAHPGA